MIVSKKRKWEFKKIKVQMHASLSVAKIEENSPEMTSSESEEEIDSDYIVDSRKKVKKKWNREKIVW